MARRSAYLVGLEISVMKFFTQLIFQNSAWWYLNCYNMVFFPPVYTSHLTVLVSFQPRFQPTWVKHGYNTFLCPHRQDCFREYVYASVNETILFQGMCMHIHFKSKQKKRNHVLTMPSPSCFSVILQTDPYSGSTVQHVKQV